MLSELLRSLIFKEPILKNFSIILVSQIISKKSSKVSN